MYNIVKRRFWLFMVSAVLIVLSIVSLATPFGRLKLSTEFSSGSRITLSFANTVSQTQLSDELGKLGYPGAIIQSVMTSSGDQGDFLVVTPVLTNDQETALVSGLQSSLGDVTVKEFTVVSAAVAQQTLTTVGWAVLAAAIFMLLYIAWAFRHMPHPFRYGTTAIIALLHDVLVSVGIFSIFAAFLKWQVDLMFITGVLTVIGFSINNTIIIFDRIRENVRMGAISNFETVVNDSLIETMGRTLNTSLVVIFAVLALMLFVGSSIQNFAFVVLVGIIAGTFDSIFVAPNLLVVWQTGNWGVPGSGSKPAVAPAK
jgi:preprotein translocase subunit SecF